jgi:hypothetical protein
MKYRAKFSRLLMGSFTSLIYITALLLTSSLVVSSQTPPVDRTAEMKELNFLIGEWKGDGGRVRSDGTHEKDFSMKVKVQSDLKNSRLRIKYSKEFSLKFPQNVFLNLPFSYAVDVYYDETAKLYRWRVDSSNGRKHPYKAIVAGPRIFQWLLESDGPPIRFTIDITDNGEWHEFSESWSNKNGAWEIFEGALLKRVK